MESLFKAIWKTPWVREVVLVVAATVGVQVAMSASDFADVLRNSSNPLGDFSTWARALSVATISTAIKQTAVWALTRWGKIAVTGRPGTRASGEDAVSAVLGDGK